MSKEDQCSSNGYSRLFGLIIGINEYDSYAGLYNLKGAVRDADDMCDFLVEKLRANPNYIANLRDTQATRKAILESLKALAKDSRIQRNDPIVIYYAGHGSRTNRPDDWRDWECADNQVEMICPADITTTIFCETVSKQEVPGIPDRTFGALLKLISHTKGNNITVILDCCHSAGADRTDNSTARMIPNPPQFPPYCDREIFQEVESQISQTPFSIKGQNQGSHVLLAACGHKEGAMESRPRGAGDPPRGDFTSALLACLREGHEHTYSSLIRNIKLTKQTPHCFGRSVDRLLFNIKAPGEDVSLLQGHLHRYESELKIIVEVGEVHGIKTDTMMAIYENSLLQTLGISVGILKVANVQQCIAELKMVEEGSHSHPVIPEVFLARELGSAITVFSNELSRLKESLATATSSSPQYNTTLHSGIVLTENIDPAQVQIIYDFTQSSPHVFFKRHQDDMAVNYVGTQFPYALPAEDSQGILNFIHRASRFYRHLWTTNPHQRVLTYLTPRGQREAFMGGIDVRFFRLSTQRFSWDLGPMGPNRIQGDKIDLVANPKEQWGMKIGNNTDVDLYLHLFFFDARDLSIEAWYHPPIGRCSSCSRCNDPTQREEEGRGEERGSMQVNAGHGRFKQQSHGDVDYSIRAHSEITIGYGDGGATPWSFTVPEGTDVDIGYLKLYLTQQAVDMRSLEQMSPFNSPTLVPAIDTSVSETMNKEHTPSSRLTAEVPSGEDNKPELLDGHIPRGGEKPNYLSGKTLLTAERGRFKPEDEDLSTVAQEGKVWATKTLLFIQRRSAPT